MPTDKSLNILDRIEMAEQAISDFLVSLHWPRLVTIEDFAFAGKYSSYDIAGHAYAIRRMVYKSKLNNILLVPPSSLRGWLAEEGMDVRQRDKKAPAIEWTSSVLGYETKYRRKSEYNHTCDAAVLAAMGRMGLRIFEHGEAIGTPRQQDIFVGTELNSKGQPKGLFLREEFYYDVLKPKEVQ